MLVLTGVLGALCALTGQFIIAALVLCVALVYFDRHRPDLAWELLAIWVFALLAGVALGTLVTSPFDGELIRLPQ